MNIPTFVYQRLLNSSDLTFRFWTVIRDLTIRLFDDPTCLLSIHGRNLQIPLSHSLPLYLHRHPNYDRLPMRLGSYIRGKYGGLSCVDVGANIGDTLAAFFLPEEENDNFLAIEPHPRYYRYLQANWGAHGNVKTVSCLCSSSSSTEKYHVLEGKGTASFIKTDRGIGLSSNTLDAIVDDIKDFPCPNVLKIDTDGHDFAVIAGANALIGTCKPAVLFECETASNPAYIETCLETLNHFRLHDYSEFLLYDNFGYLIGNFPLDDLTIFKNLLFYQLVSDFHYFDILILRDEDTASFYASEVEHFVGQIPDRWQQQSARTAAESGT